MAIQKRNFAFSLIFLLQLTSICFSQSQWSIKNVFQEGKYTLTRNVDMDKRTIQFEAVVETLGYVGLGLSPNGGMGGADIFIGGVKDGRIYFGDYHALNNSRPIQDDHNDWIVDTFKENSTHTGITVSRNLDVCDPQDVAITENGLSIIWAYGTTDDIEFHGNNKGTIRANLLDPPMPVEDTSQFSKWPILVNDTMPSLDTSYMCSVHTHPPMESMGHMVGFAALVEGKLAVDHTHHFLFRKCIVTDETRPQFEEYLGKPAIPCQTKHDAEVHPLQHLCGNYVFVWAKGGGPTMLPENVGLPINENSNETEYYMIEIHYDNPNKTENVRFETGLEIYYTTNLRNETAGIVMIGHSAWWAHTIPPNTPDFKTVGHCPSECTEAALPPTGINVFNVFLHSHLSGRNLKLRHFRGNEELPWLSVDQNYDFNFQQNRPLRKEISIERGDHLTYECITDTTWKNGEITIGDLGTSDEMCEVFIMYYPRVNMDFCASTYPPLQIMEDFGIKNLTDNPDAYNNPIITEPEIYAGRNYTDYMTHVFPWTTANIEDFQLKVLQSDHEFYCASTVNSDFVLLGETNFPNVEPYTEENKCLSSTTTDPGLITTTGSAITLRNQIPLFLIFTFAIFQL